MKNAVQSRILAVVLAAVTLAACVLAGLNLAQESSYEEPTDGIWWVEATGGLCAQQVPADSPGQRAGIRAGDVLQSVDEIPTPRLAPLMREIYHMGSWSHATYTIARNPQRCQIGPHSTRLDIQVILEPTDRSINQGLRLIALVYLLIGLYVLFRRWTAPKSVHFYVFCLVSFVLYSFKFTSKFDTLDQFIYWSNIIATALQPALFLHFAVSFSESADPRRLTGRRILTGLLYLPAVYLVGLHFTAIRYWSATELLKHRIDKIDYAYMAFYYVVAAILFFLRSRYTESTLQRQQLKWLTRGTLVVAVPFTLLYVLPFLLDLTVPTLFANIVRLSFVVLPLTFSWAIVRYRLMDVDLIFKRGVTYTLATAALAGLYFGIVAVSAETVHSRLQNTKAQSHDVWGLLAAIVATALIFEPLKKAIQARVDRVFDQKRFDYRETLVDFGRSLNSQTDLRALVDSIVERLPQTLLVTRVAVFLTPEDDSSQRLQLAASHGLGNLHAAELESLDLGFLDFDAPDANTHIFLENPQQVLRLPDSERHAAARLDLNYYLPCRVANRQGPGTRTVAIIGLGRTTGGDFLSSEDMEVLESLAGYIGIAIQNAQLYRRLEQKINDFERLTDFNQNIVESIDIGILAVDLDDNIESWNTRMEVMFARPRAEALRRPLSEIFSAEFLSRFDAARDEHGTHTLYKFRLALPNGESRIANIAIAPLVTKSFQTIGRIILVDDITDRIELENQLTQSEKLSSIGLLAAGVAHEVNTPLAVISSYTQMLTKQLRDDTRLAPVLEKITQQTFRASEIVNGLLNFSRTSGTEFTSIDLNQLLRDSSILLEHQFKTAQIHVGLHLSSTLPLVQGNQGKLQQVILNLLLNAKDSMQGVRTAALTVSTQAEAGRAVVLIRDTGTGIAREHLHRIFDPFFTTKTNPQAGQHKGTGLGLAVSYGILQEHSGKISVESELGIGTTFRLEFPASVPVADPTAAATPVGAP
ncbi:PAS domain S-box protein [Granulicella sp. WH15]|uniref:ATP-binding protein n=1 Tax=Granulicella sp. WH15 TaxID=2602070 RepID=UPI001366A8AF|nr:ATP-binding protein [Granulicella sp. WH15]QHN03540.1 PAS domain S-box protein [Granulicella sp. WH15]